MLKVYLLRHGETQYNADGNRYCGRTDVPLTAKGLNQANLVHKQLSNINFDAVYSSPLERARHTAEIASGNKQVTTNKQLIEVNFGTWEGKTKEEFIAQNASLWHSWMEDPTHVQAGGTGETALEVVERVNNFFNDMVKKHPAGTILVVGHNGINRLFMAYKLGMPLKNYRRIVQENSSVTLFTLDTNTELSLEKLNATL